MVVLTIEEWQRQSTLLIQARPTTTRITTKYNIPNLESAKYNKSKKRKRNTGIDEKEEEQQQQEAAPRIPRATLTLKTFDPESGVVLQFKTDRAADVGRAINGLGRLGRYMAALPEQVEGMLSLNALSGWTLSQF
ncbi:signal recognition particle 9 kDa protein-domain-containing protein [Neohortaea acidophila]|uniref:Signal recognition particle 9 kDa protein-domain-containing protein n=1 Tax=Neohortaea acidophila TaxID=245834 RepID=A0A6A6Q2V7_9PEZI|nr:signal recognition particle 9 kDa protein-domain-containing protein [Neohortaea acidophila]KAF2486276.1 signal recognition particle 9 kDa protein-domain-containing protein [Neohortaea acidophila]